ncbi:MAG: WD40 repeat domain-containing protein [Anaerolineales bacterium]
MLDAQSLEITREFDAGPWVIYLAVSPSDGNFTRGAHGNRNGSSEIQVWNLGSDQPLVGLPLGLKTVTDVDFDMTGSFLAAGTSSGEILLWDAVRWTPLQPLNDPQRQPYSFVRRVRFSRDGSRLAAVDATGRLSIFNVASRQVEASINTGFESVASMDFNRSSEAIVIAGSYSHDNSATSGADRVMVFAVPSGSPTYTINIPEQGSVDFALFSPDGQSVLVGYCGAWSSYSGACYKGIVETRSSADGSRQSTLPEYPTEPLAAAYSPQGDRLALLTAYSVEVWNVGTHKQASALNWYVGPSAPVQFAQDGQFVVSGDPDGEVRFWGARDGRMNQSLTVSEDAVVDFALSPSGQLLAICGSGGPITIWDLGALSVIRTIPIDQGYQVSQLTFSEDEASLVWYEGKFETTRVRVYSLARETIEISERIDSVSGISLDSQSPLLAIGQYTESSDNVRVMDLLSGSVVWSHRAPGIVTSLAFSPDGRLLAVGTDEPSIYIYRTDSWSLQHELAPSSKPSTSYSPVYLVFFDRAPILASTVGWEFKLWDVNDYHQLLESEQQWLTANVTGISPDGLEAAISPGDHTTIIWELSGVPEETK